MTAHPVWFKSIDGEWNQINGVIDIVVATPLVGRGTYRDKPPVIPGTAGGAISGAVPASLGGGSTLLPGTQAGAAAMQIAGGVNPSASTAQSAGLEYVRVTASGASSVLNDDDYNSEPLRYVFGPEPIIFFKTSVSGAPSLPDANAFGTDRPAVPVKGSLASGGKFPIFTGDCFFGWDPKYCGVKNTPPQGWKVYDPA